MNTDAFSDIGLIDTHVHLDTLSPVEPAIARAEAAGIKGIVSMGLYHESNIRTLELAERFPQMVFPAIGYHPGFIIEDDMEKTLGFIDKNLAACTALGEVGLDYKVTVSKSVQIAVFKEALDLARKHHKPVNIHSRHSFDKTLDMVLAAGVSKAVFHWYSGPIDILDSIIGNGFFISATPALAYSRPHRAAIERAPLSHILVETDAPEKYQGIVSEPATLIETIEHLSRVKDIPAAEAAQVTAANAAFFYDIEKDKNGLS